MNPTPSSAESNRRAFAAQAAQLAEWTEARLVNRRDAWGAYHVAGGQLTRRGQLTKAHLVRHY